MIVPVNIGLIVTINDSLIRHYTHRDDHFFSGPTFYMTTEFEVSVIVRLFSLRGRIQMCVFGGGGGRLGRGRREGDKGEWEIPLPIPNTDVL